MTPDAIFRELRRQPFRPFRIYVLEKTTFEIRHPEMAIIGGLSVEVFAPVGPTDIPVAVLDVLLISRLEPIVSPTSPAVNGA